MIYQSEFVEVFYAQPGNADSFSDTLTLGDAVYQCLPVLTEYPVSMEEYSIVDCFGFVVPQESDLKLVYSLQRAAYGEYASEISNNLVLDFSEEDRVEAVFDDFYESLQGRLREYINAIPGTTGAMPILTKLLRVLFSADQMLFMGCTVGTLAAFTLLYVVIYRMTARTYYQLVRRGTNK